MNADHCISHTSVGSWEWESRGAGGRGAGLTSCTQTERRIEEYRCWANLFPTELFEDFKMNVPGGPGGSILSSLADYLGASEHALRLLVSILLGMVESRRRTF